MSRIDQVMRELFFCVIHIRMLQDGGFGSAGLTARRLTLMVRQ